MLLHGENRTDIHSVAINKSANEKLNDTLNLSKRSIKVREMIVNDNQNQTDKPTFKMKNIEERPQSALLRGVKVTQVKESKVNPEPLTIDDYEYLIDDHMSPLKLSLLTGQDDLSKVITLELKINAEEVSLNNFGKYVPNLETLKLVQSKIHILRDLGSLLKKLKTLYMPRCELNDLDGLASFVSLRQLYLPYNDISDVSSCSLLENLSVLDLEGNNIDDVCQITFLSFCPRLTTLTLEGNPLCLSPNRTTPVTNASYDYRKTVIEMIGNKLEILDNEPIVRSIVKPSLKIEEKKNKEIIKSNQDNNNGSQNNMSVLKLEEDWNMLDELMKDGQFEDEDDDNYDANILNAAEAARPVTSRPISSLSHIHRMGSSLKPSGFQIKSKFNQQTFGKESSKNISTSRLGDSIQSIPLPSPPSSATPTTGYSDESGIYSGCESATLSARSAVCGNLARALRSKKQARVLHESEGSLRTHELMIHDRKSFKEKPIENLISTMSKFKSLDHEIETMKKEIKKSVQLMNDRKAPQVLKITHDDDDDASGSDVIDVDDEDCNRLHNKTLDQNNNGRNIEYRVNMNREEDEVKRTDDMSYNEYINELSKSTDYNVSIDEKRQSLMRAADFFADLSDKPLDFSHIDKFQDNFIEEVEKEDEDEVDPANKNSISSYNREFTNLSLPKPPSNYLTNIDENNTFKKKKNFIGSHESF